jgi:hypothetical protein
MMMMKTKKTRLLMNQTKEAQMPHKFKPLKSRYRATFSGTEGGASRLGKIDTENEVLHDVQITLEGEALGHDVWLDREFCEAVAQQGNATGDVGLKVRYGHPAMCSDAIGTELGRAKNFRVVDIDRTIDGQTVKCAGVIADVHLLKSAHAAPQGDIAKHVLETAAEDPKQFGQSIVFTYSDWVVKDKDGNRHSYNEEVANKDAELTWDGWFKQSADGKVYAVLGKLHGSDFTDTPAATDGIFSTGTLAEEAEQMFDEHPEVLDAIEKNPKSLVEFLARTGLDKKLESARVAGLQAAKDKEIAALKEKIAANDDAVKKAALDTVNYGAVLLERDRLKADLEAQNTKLETLSTEIAEKTTALDSAKAEIEQLRAKVGDAEKALADSQAALAAETERYREQIGAALQPPKSALSGLHGRELAVAALRARA